MRYSMSWLDMYPYIFLQSALHSQDNFPFKNFNFFLALLDFNQVEPSRAKKKPNWKGPFEFRMEQTYLPPVGKEGG